MEYVIVGLVVAFCALMLGRNLWRRTGLGAPQSKPDCGCGSCHQKNAKPQRGHHV